MNKLYIVLVAGLLAVSTAADAAQTRKSNLQTRLSALWGAVKRSGPGSTLFQYGVGGTAWYFASKELAKKGFFSTDYPTYASYLVGGAGAGELLDGTVPGAATLGDLSSELGFLYTVADLMANELGKKLPEYKSNPALAKLAYMLIGYKAVKLVATYGPGIAYDVISSEVTALANALANADSCAACPPCDQTAAQVTAL